MSDFNAMARAAALRSLVNTVHKDLRDDARVRLDELESAETERDALREHVADYDMDRTLLLAELAAAQDRAHYAATERDALAARLEWLRLSMVWVPATVPVYKSRVGIVQPAAEFYANLAAAVAAEKDGGDGA